MKASWVGGMAVALLAVALLAVATVSDAEAKAVVTGGQTSVLLDTATLESAASLSLSGVAGDVIAPGALGANSVAFPINARDASPRPTTFSYDSADPLGTLSGDIEHSGSVLFNNDTIEVGNFTIGSDFTVRDNVSGLGVLFDAAPNPSTLVANNSRLFVEGDLQVAKAFADFLQDNGFADADLTGADVGDFQVDAAVVPIPGAALLLGSAVVGLGVMRVRRRRTAEA